MSVRIGKRGAVISVVWRNALLSVFGAWFVVSAFLLNPLHSSQYQWTVFVLGGLLLIGGLWSLGDAVKRPWRHWVMALCGLELALSGWRSGTAILGGVYLLGTVLGICAMAAAIWEAL